MTRESRKWMKFRITTLLALFLVLFAVLGGRAFSLQVLDAKKLKTLAQKQHTQTLQLHPDRGIIYDRNGGKLAATVMTDSVCADPSKIGDPAQAAKKLASILKVNRAALQKKLAGQKSFCWIARRIDPAQAALVLEQNIDGVFLIKEPKRFYPNGELAGHLVGFVGVDSSGLEGLELRYDRLLKGPQGVLTWTRDAKGKKLYPRMGKQPLSESEKEPYNLVLTIDNHIQYLVESHLKNAVRDKEAKGGFAIVMDPRTGEILALANQKGFDPNRFSEVNPASGKNKAITDCFDPGSTFKPFLMAAALEEGVAKETDRFFCENGHYAIANRVVREAQRKQHGNLSLAEILKYSSNIGSVKIAERLGKEKFYDYIRNFGFGAKTGIDLPGEVNGLLRPVEKWTRVDAANVAFGQGISVTAIQMITAFSAIANQGILMKPFIVKGLTDQKDNLVHTYDPVMVRRVISPETARRLTNLLADVVGAEDGTGQRARIVNVSVAGKTGTAQKYDASSHSYSSEQVKTSFIGFFPADNPQLAILVVLDEPQRDKWGGVATAPVFRDIGEQLLTRFKTHIRTASLPTEERDVPQPKLQFVSTPAVLPSMVSTAMAMPIPLVTETQQSLVPDFRGLTIREVLKRANELGLTIQIKGSGWAAEQRPAANSPIPASRLCTVTFATGS